MLLLMLLIGGVGGLMVDIMSLAHRGKTGLPQSLTDAFCCMGCGVLCALALIFTGQRGMRIYGALGLILGWLIYDLGLRRLIMSFFSGIKKLFKKCTGFLMQAGNASSKANTYENTSQSGGRKP